MSEQNKDAELRQIVTDALIGMVSGVTGMVPPTGPGAIPDFIKAPIDRAVEKIRASLPVGVPVQWSKSLGSCWPADEESPEGDWLIGTIDEDGNRFEVIRVEAAQYDAEGESQKIAEAIVALWSSATAAPTVKAEQVDDLSAEVESMVRALEEGEWAEHAGQTEIGARLESAITTLINRLPASSLPAAGSADLPPPDFALDGGSQPCYYAETVQRIVAALPAAGSAVEEVEVVGYVNVRNGVRGDWLHKSETAARAHDRTAIAGKPGGAEPEPLMTVAQHELIVAALSDELQTERARADAAVGDANDAERALSAMKSAQDVSVPRELVERIVDARSDKNRKEARQQLRALLNGGEA
jgi:hypothetical protein